MAHHRAPLSSLLALASACPTMAAVPGDNQLGYRFSQYQEADTPANRVASGSSQRYDISIHQLHWRQTLADSWQLQADASLESMTGASALQT